MYIGTGGGVSLSSRTSICLEKFSKRTFLQISKNNAGLAKFVDRATPEPNSTSSVLPSLHRGQVWNCGAEHDSAPPSAADDGVKSEEALDKEVFRGSRGA